MDFEKWWETEGSVMEEGHCNPEIIARAAWTVSRNEVLADGEPDFDITPPEVAQVLGT